MYVLKAKEKLLVSYDAACILTLDPQLDILSLPKLWRFPRFSHTFKLNLRLHLSLVKLHASAELTINTLNCLLIIGLIPC
jgi:hypothetical protein